MRTIGECITCAPVEALLERGLSPDQIEQIGRVAAAGADARCDKPPERMPGGWMRCHAHRLATAALVGAELGIQTAEALQAANNTV